MLFMLMKINFVRLSSHHAIVEKFDESKCGKFSFKLLKAFGKARCILTNQNNGKNLHATPH